MFSAAVDLARCSTDMRHVGASVGGRLVYGLGFGVAHEMFGLGTAG